MLGDKDRRAFILRSAVRPVHIAGHAAFLGLLACTLPCPCTAHARRHGGHDFPLEEGQSVTLSYTDTGMMPAEISLSAFGAELERRKATLLRRCLGRQRESRAELFRSRFLLVLRLTRKALRLFATARAFFHIISALAVSHKLPHSSIRGRFQAVWLHSPATSSFRDGRISLRCGSDHGNVGAAH